MNIIDDCSGSPQSRQETDPALDYGSAPGPVTDQLEQKKQEGHFRGESFGNCILVSQDARINPKADIPPKPTLKRSLSKTDSFRNFSEFFDSAKPDLKKTAKFTPENQKP